MNEYIESGILELYVFGVLTENENKEVQEMAQKHPEVQAEILSIERAVIDLSYSVSPQLSPEVYHRIRQQLIEKHGGVIPMQPRRRGISSYIGWAAAIILLFAVGIQYLMYQTETEKVQSANKERSKFEQMLAGLTKENNKNEEALKIIRDKNNSVIPLAGQQVAPDAYAKVYLNNAEDKIYVDIAGLPEPPEGKVYQVWAIMLNPLTPTSIGVLDKNQLTENKGIYPVDNFEGVQAFGITLEPAGGSAAPTMEQLYTLGEVRI